MQQLHLTAYAGEGAFQLDAVSSLKKLQELVLMAEMASSVWVTEGQLSRLTSLQTFRLSGSSSVDGPVIQALGVLLQIKIVSCDAVPSSIEAVKGIFTVLKQLIIGDPDADIVIVSPMALQLVPLGQRESLMVGDSFGSLKMLSINTCKITTAPVPLRLMPCLTQVAFADCEFASDNWLTEAVRAASHINQLSMPACGLHQIPCGLHLLTSLERLDMHCNHLSELPLCLSCLTALTFLDVDDCKLEHMPFMVEHLPAISAYI